MTKILKILFFFITLSSIAQSEKENTVEISGIVYSSVNNKPLSDVIVSFDSRSRGASTGENGEFKYVYNLRSGDSIERIETVAMGYKPLDTIINVNRGKNINLNIILKPHRGINRLQALDHIKIGKINLLLSGGIAPVVYQSDEKFSKKYNLNFVEFGCEAVPEESLYEYNKTVFEYLDKKYGKNWRKEIRKDVVGLKNK
ncbi:carboxypeptidase-like regulatory domain-containing protein [uncultured Aquimarina sp.]|uniref:FEKKY domain-containing protein n=1 Tax=uncultured Aquimarina sp. TaxID=575652 RepID=UPI00260F0001|nr:carboxypeptidase-like regulatory domain-containing protein [uncultured Aquimarina sp.]